MAQNFSKTDIRRITFLSLHQGHRGDYDAALADLERMEAEGFFDTEVSPSFARPNGRSGRPASGSRSGNSGRGRDSQRSGGYSGQMRDPDGPPTDKQVDLLLDLTDDYTEREVRDMTKQEVSNLINDLKG